MKFLAAFALLAVACADVSHISNQYLPPAAPAPQADAPIIAPTTQYIPPQAPIPFGTPQTAPAAATFNEQDGYNYKNPSVRRRRDVSHISNQYLPPVADAPVVDFAAAPAPAAATFNEQDGYNYKNPSVRRRRDVSNQYLPPVAPASIANAPVVDFAAAPEPAAATFNEQDGYNYKNPSVRRRRDVSHLSNQYLPPVAPAPLAAPISAPTNQYLPPQAPAFPQPAPAATFNEQDGYDYKNPSVRRRRDVSHLSNQYLPPVAPAPLAAPISAPTNQYLPPQAPTLPQPAPAATFNEQDGYNYKNPTQF